jgi:UrcA family protein
MTRSIAAIIIGLAMTSVAHSAAPAADKGFNQVKVEYSDLDLEKEAGAATLLRRLSRAAKNVCGAAHLDVSNFHQKRERVACRMTALQNAVADVNHPIVTALYQNTQSNVSIRLATR